MNNTYNRNIVTTAPLALYLDQKKYLNDNSQNSRYKFVLLTLFGVMLLITTSIFVLDSHTSKQIVTSASTLSSFLPRDFVLPANLSIRGRLSNQQHKSTLALRSFIINKITADKIAPVQAEKITAAILDAAQRTGLDPLLIAAIARAESSFRADATSPVGAMGLMQLMPETAKYIGKKIDLPVKSKADVYQVERNLVLGSAYFIYLNRMFQGNMQRSLIAYNWGPGNAQMAATGRLRVVPAITLNYARTVTSTHRNWRAEFNQLK